MQVRAPTGPHSTAFLMMRARRFPSRLVLWAALAAPILVLAGCTAGRIRDSVELARASEPLQRSVEHARARLLIVGDSTAVGTGASSPRSSLGGLLAQAFPDLHIDNRGRDGATFADVERQLEGSARYDVVLIQAGGNDVIRLRDMDVVAADIDRVVRRARERAELVLLMPAGNVGNAPFFFRPVSWLMTSRARRLHESVRETAARQGAVYINLFKERADDPFAKRPELNARDGLHPSDQGYQVWFETLMAQSGLAQRLAATTAHAPLAARDARCEHRPPSLSTDWST
jgi:lysophospholipase L1-like esterase